MNKPLPTTGPELRKLREAANVSAESVALRAGVIGASISNFERGAIRNPIKIAEILAAYEHLDEMPKRKKLPPKNSGPRRPKIKPENPVEEESEEPKKTWTPERLHEHIRAFVYENDLTIVERGRSGQRTIAISQDQLFELGALLLLACGHNVR